LLKKPFSGIGEAPLISFRRKCREVAHKVPTEEWRIDRGGRGIYLYLDFYT